MENNYEKTILRLAGMICSNKFKITQGSVIDIF